MTAGLDLRTADATDTGQDAHAWPQATDGTGWDEICRCDGICECGDGGTDPGHAAERDWADANGGGW